MPRGYYGVPCSTKNTKRPNTKSWYKTPTKNLIQFSELGILASTLQLNRLDEGENMEATLVAHKAVYHIRYVLCYNTTMLQRAQKRTRRGGSSSDSNIAGKRTRSRSCDSITSDQTSCFFCRQSGVNTLHEATTFTIGQRVRKCEKQLGDYELLA